MYIRVLLFLPSRVFSSLHLQLPFSADRTLFVNNYCCIQLLYTIAEHNLDLTLVIHYTHRFYSQYKIFVSVSVSTIILPCNYLLSSFKKNIA